jgi:TetR/AcrR family transcriptional repressor of nem operon
MVAERGRGDPDTATRILDVAERLAQARGFNGFSYADIAAELGITKAALHSLRQQGPTWARLIDRYAVRSGDALAATTPRVGATAAARLRRAHADVLRNQRMCQVGCWRPNTRHCPAR